MELELTPEFLCMLIDMTSPMRMFMLDHLTDEDLAFRVPGNPTLGEQCREHGNVQRRYLQAYKTGHMDDRLPGDDSPELASSVEKLRAWYIALDDEFKSTLMAFPNDKFRDMTIERSGRAMPAGVHFLGYREAELIFCAKCSVYLRMMGKPLNDQWLDWIG